jgi:DinB family protein
MDDVGTRIATAGEDLLAMGPDLLAGEPWPLSATYGTEPEADWGPREVLGHVDEMLRYWISELGRVVAGDPSGRAVEFGRVATDPSRLARIAEERQRPTAELLPSIAEALGDATGFIRRLGPADLARTGAHPTRGELTVEASLDRFLASHLEEHVRQLHSILADAPGR